MILVQKQPQLSSVMALGGASMSPAYSHHRRHPSAPIVQATRTPGLLSLSKPPVVAHPRGKPHRSPKPAHAQQQQGKERENRVENKEKTPSATTPDKCARGRQHAKPKSHTRQPSPPTSTSPPRQHQPRTPSQAEATHSSNNLSDSDFDPFIVTPSSDKASVAKREARNKPVKRPQVPASASFSVATPTPISKSQPRRIPLPRPVSLPHAAIPSPFPVCDDNDDDELSTPTTPPSPVVHRSLTTPSPAMHGSLPTHSFSTSTPQAQKKKPTINTARSYGYASEGAPHTAPLSSATTTRFPFARTPSPSPAPSRQSDVQRAKKWQGMSLEEKEAQFEQEAFAKYGIPTRADRAAEKAAQQKGFFASSTFQNSPSPEELPDPNF
ncbi:hypothetical protein PLICRDRAFT_176486 [Plicaturopsis crispa FD-325 SS-3]|nr:hypothetical protein PLICRDRAFT_176486 [Plicaturopsis crispa FD-325 SS-3]